MRVGYARTLDKEFNPNLEKMITTYIQFYTKNHSLFGDRIEIHTEAVPRVGEIIDAHEFLELSNDQVSDFMVLSVIYKLTKDGFSPYITARQWHKGLRHELLESRGWLSPKDRENLTYDEDDPARWEDVDQ
ncbi:hypothetical protein JIN77_02175 [Verrucomicrobiaceae bacterium R5-34]|nr:hypothetical protein [Verrucomicrobiaceae bacterium R5-34]